MLNRKKRQKLKSRLSRKLDPYRKNQGHHENQRKKLHKIGWLSVLLVKKVFFHVTQCYRLWFTLTLSHFYLCVCVCVCVCVSARFLENGWTDLHEIFTQNAYGATDVPFGGGGYISTQHISTQHKT